METTKKSQIVGIKKCRYRNHLLFYYSSLYLSLPIRKSVQLYEQ